MAGWGTRMRPHTWSKPKPLVNVAGKTSFEHLMDLFDTLPEPNRTEYVFIVGPYLGETQIPAFVEEHYPDINAHFVVQGEMKGQSHALYLARQYLTGPMLMIFSDTLIDADFSFLEREKSDGVAWVKAVEDPRRFGVVDVNEEGWIKRLIEKPDTKENDLAVVGCYYFKSGENLMAAIEEQMQQNVKLKNEFFLADAINILLERGALMRVDAFLLERMDAKPDERPGVKVLPPVFIHPTAEVSEAVIGPNASIGADCKITQAVIQDSIIAGGTHISQAALIHSLIGSDCVVEGQPNKEEAASLNIGDNSEVRFDA